MCNRHAPGHQNYGDDKRGQELDLQQVGPNMHQLGPPGLEGEHLAVMGLGELGICFQLVNQAVIGLLATNNSIVFGPKNCNTKH